MSEITPPAVVPAAKDETPTPASVGGGEPHKVFATPEDLTAYKSKIQEEATRKQARAEAELAALKAKHQTDAEKAAEAAEIQRKAEMENYKAEALKTARVSAALMSKGMSEAQATNLAGLAKGETTEEALAHLEAEYGVKASGGQYGGGGGQGQTQPDKGRWTPERIEREMPETPMEAMKFWQKNEKDILKDQARGQVNQTFAPGQFSLKGD